MRISETFSRLPAIAARKEIPAHRRRRQWINTVAGGFVFLLGFAAPNWLGFPWKVGLAVAAFGAFIVSKQLVLDFLKAVPQAIGAVVTAMKGSPDKL